MAKKIWEMLEEDEEKNREQNRQDIEQANRNFEEYTSKHGTYDTNKHTTSIGELRKAYKTNKSDVGKERYDNLNKSLNHKYYNDENSFGHKFINAMTAPVAKNRGSYSQMMGITNYKGEIDDNKLAERNMQNANTIMKMQTAKRAYDEAQNESIRSSLLYKQAKTQNPNATDEELLKIAKENGNKFYNDMIDDIASKNALERTERIKDLSRLDSNPLLYDNNKFNNINNQVLQYKVSKEAQEEAEKINNGDSKAIGHILSNMPMKTLEAVGDPLYAMGSALNLKLPTATADQQLQEYKILKSKNDLITANIDNGFTKTASQMSGTIGYMIPSILAELVAPGSGRILQGVSVGGSGYVENLNEDASNKLKSALTGAGKGYASYAIEGLAGGNFFGKGSLDDIATRTIASKTSNAISRKIASKIYQYGGETVEELLENQVDYLIDAVVNDKGITLKQWLEEQGETAKSTFATTLILDMLGLGGSIENDVKTYSQNQEANYWINEAQKIIKKENLGLNDKNVQMFNNNKEVQEVLSQLQAKENIDNQMLPVSNNPNSYSSKINSLANNQETLYNNTNEMESGINGGEQEKIGRNDQGGIEGLLPSNKGRAGNDKGYQTNIKGQQEIEYISDSNNHIKDLNDNQKNIQNRFQSIGIPVNFYSFDTRTGGRYYNDGIYVNTYNMSDEQQANTAIHEYAHYLLRNNTNFQNEISPLADRIIENETTGQSEGIRNYIMQRDENITTDEITKIQEIALEEILADYMIDIDNDVDFNIDNQYGIDVGILEDYKNIAKKYLPQNNNLVKNDTITNNYAQNQENNTTENTKGEKVEWNDIKRPEDNRKFRKHYQSVIESSNTTAEAKKIARELMNQDTYVPESNKGQLQNADERIFTNGADKELDTFSSKVDNGDKITSIDIAIGERLIEYYSKIGDKEKLQEAIQSTAMAGTQAGQTVQALALLNHQTPQGQATWIDRNVNKLNREIAHRKGGTITKDENGNNIVINKKGEDITNKVQLFDFTPDMKQRIMETQNKEQMNEVIEEIYNELGQQVPKTLIQKLDSWRYFSMLANFRTHVRNVVGNLGMGKMQGVKNKVAGAIEDTVAIFNKDMERNHTLKPASKEVKQFAKEDLKNIDVQTRLELNNNKYNPKSRIENAQKTFKTEALEKTVGKAFEANEKSLEVEDSFGLKSAYAKSLSEYMTANKLTPDTITEQQLAKARNYAIDKAKEATFHSRNAIATAVYQFSRKNGYAKFAADAILPFVKTPMNVAKAGMEYNPTGLIKALTVDSVRLRKGDITVNQYIDNISKGLTGTGLSVLGYAMANAGIIKASGGDDDKKENYDEALGKQSYSLIINGKSYSLDWIGPLGMPLFVGAEAFNIKQARKEEKSSISSDDDKKTNQIINSLANWGNAMANSMSPMAEMSMISGLTSALKSYEQGSAKMLGQIGTNMVKSYVNQYIPTALGHIAKTTDEYERSTTSTKTDMLSKAIDQTKLQTMAKIPGLRQKLPAKTDIWGNEQKQEENIVKRALNNAVYPFVKKDIINTNVDKELDNLYNKTGETSILPETSLSKTFTINNQKYRMTDEEYAEYRKQYGKQSFDLLNNLVSSSNYKEMNDEEKEFAISKVYEYVKEQLKSSYANNNKLEYKESNLVKTISQIKKANGNTSNYFEYLALSQDKKKDSEHIEILTNSRYSKKVKEIIYENNIKSDNDKKYNIVKEISGNKFNIDSYLDYKLAVSNEELKADRKDDGTEDGKAITSGSGSSKSKTYNYINNMENTSYMQRIVMYGLDKAPQKSDKQVIVNYINNMEGISAERKKEMLKQFSWITFYKDGRFKY